MKPILRIAAAVAILVTLSCSSADRSAGPGAITRKSDATLLAGVSVSGPVAAASSAPDRAAVDRTDAPNASVSYVSLVPGTVSDGTIATITNLRTADHLTVAIVDGGFDPQAIPANLMDTIEVAVRRAGKPDLSSYLLVAKPSPRIVRTRPPRGQTDVPLNTAITIIFSEPVDPASVSATTVTLSAGSSPVAGDVHVLPDTGYIVEFMPKAMLVPLTTYTLTVHSTVVNGAGTPSDSPTSITFTTGSSTGSTSLTVSPDSEMVSVGQTVELTATVKDAAGKIVSPNPNLAEFWWTSSAPDIAGVLSQGRGEVVGIGAGTVVITARIVWNGYVLTDTARITVSPTTIPVGAIVFRRCSELGGFCGLYAVEPTGAYGRLLTSSDVDLDPAWSPDGSAIAFRSQRGCDRATTRICHNDLYVMKADGSGAGANGSGLRLLTSGSGLDVGGMSWSPDGSRIVFTGAVYLTDQYLSYALYVMNADGSGVRLLASPPPASSFASPDWSPDGGRIAYSLVIPGDTSTIHVMAADGSNDVPLSAPSGFIGDVAPRWSPDGRRIAFSRWRWQAPAGIEWRSFVMNADGSNVTPLTLDPQVLLPAWSPDGTSFAAGGPSGLILINADGSGTRSIFPTYDDIGPFSWRRAAAVVPSAAARTRIKP